MLPMDGRVRPCAPARGTGRRILLLFASVATLLLALAPAGSSARQGANPLAGEQTYLGAIRVPAFPSELEPVLVGVLDGGIDAAHPDLAGRIAATRSFAPASSTPQEEHGTATAGLIAAIAGNGTGIDGIAPNARLLFANVAGATGDSFDEAAVARAIRWAADSGARVLSLSLVTMPGPGIEAAVDHAVARGVLVVAAAGNCWDGAETRFARCAQATDGVWPAWLPHVLAVGATGDDYASPLPADFSVPSRRWVDIAAPGSLITTLWPTRNNPYAPAAGCAYPGTTACYWTGGTPNRRWGPSGTSYAAPMVAAAAAILFGAAPQLRPEQVLRLLEETARPLARDPLHQAGAGLLVRHRGTGPRPSRRDSGRRSRRADEVRPAPLPRSGRLNATVDWYDDPADAYAVPAGAGRRLTVRTSGNVDARVRVEFGGTTVATRRLGGVLRVRIPRAGRARIAIVAAPGARGAYSLEVGSASRTSGARTARR